MSSTTESESSDEFFDAEDNTPNRLGKKKSPKNASESRTVAQSVAVNDYDKKSLEQIRAQRESVEKLRELEAQKQQEQNKFLLTSESRGAIAGQRSSDEYPEFVEPKQTGRQRFKELRQNMQNDDDENIGNTLTPESQNSSADGVYYATQRTTHPFRIMEHDTASLQSMTSLGRVGRILAGSLDPSAISVGRSGDSASINVISKSSSAHYVQGITQTTPTSPSQLTEESDNEKVSNRVETLSTKTNESIESSASSQKVVMNSGIGSGGVNSGSDKTINTMALQEPDVITCTKLAQTKSSDNNLLPSRPVVPPRTKKKHKKLSNSSSENNNANDDNISYSLPSSSSMLTNNHAATATSAISTSTTSAVLDNSDNSSSNKAETESVKSSSTNRDDDIESTKSEYGPSSNSAAALAATASSSASNQNAIETFQREMENSFSHGGISTATSSGTSTHAGGTSRKSASLNRIYQSLGNSTTSINSKAASPSNSAKSNSAPSRVSSIDPNQGLNLYKATQGRYVVKPQDEETNKAVGPTQDEIKRMRSEILGTNSRERVNLAGTGTNSLGNGSRYESLTSIRAKTAKDRRKSAGDEDIMKQLNCTVRTHTDSGKELTDIEILQQVPVKNLDTGENFPLSVVEEKLPELKKKMNPLSFHIMRLTSEVPEMDEEGSDIPADAPPPDEEEIDAEEGSRLRKKTEKLRRFFGSTMRKTVDKAKSIASEVSHHRHKEDVAEVSDVINPDQVIKIKASNANKGPYEFMKLEHMQDLTGDTGAVWCMKFSSCGRLLATAGQDKVLRIWVLKDAYAFFQDMRTKYNTEKASPTPSQESLVSQSSSAEEAIAMVMAGEKSKGPFMPRPFCTYTGHTSDLLDVSWSKNYFILSSSMDKTVRLWHISRKECLCCFQHIDFVTAIAFHPRDDRYFLSGSLDGKLRLWNIPDKKVALWNEVDGQTKLITAANFCQNGKFAVVGSYDGRCIFYTTDQLKYHTQIHVRSTRGRNATGRKISGIEPMPGEDKILVTSNDSRIRLYDLRDLNLSCKYKGYLNASSQIKGSFSHDGKYIIAGSENQCIYIWKTHHDYAKLSSVRRDRNDFWEGIKAHNTTVTCAIFAPHPEAIIKPDSDEMSSEEARNYQPDPLVEQHKKGCGYVLVSADFNGAIKVFINRTKPKHSSLPYTAVMD